MTHTANLPGITPKTAILESGTSKKRLPCSRFFLMPRAAPRAPHNKTAPRNTRPIHRINYFPAKTPGVNRSITGTLPNQINHFPAKTIGASKTISETHPRHSSDDLRTAGKANNHGEITSRSHRINHFPTKWMGGVKVFLFSRLEKFARNALKIRESSVFAPKRPAPPRGWRHPLFKSPAAPSAPSGSRTAPSPPPPSPRPPH